MSYSYDKSDDSVVISGWEQGMAVSPHKGIGSIKCGNISTESGEVMCNYARTANMQDFTVTASILEHAAGFFSYTTSDGSLLSAGNWVTISNSTCPQLTNGTHYIVDTFVSGGFNQIEFAATFTITPVPPTSGNPNTATLSFLANTTSTGGIMTQAVQSATEPYFDINGAQQYRYYICDTEGHIWVRDTGTATSTPYNRQGATWVLPDITTARASSAANLGSGAMATGMAVYNGFIFIFIQDTIIAKLTSELGVNVNTSAATIGWFKVANTTSGALNATAGINIPHFAYTSKSGFMYWADGSFVDSLFQTVASGSSIFSYGTYTFSTTTLTLTDLIGGAKPYGGMAIGVFSSAGTSNLPSGLSPNTTYYVKIGSVSNSGGTVTFQIASSPSGSAISLSGGSGTQYFNTLDVTWASTNPSYTLSIGAVTIPQQSDQVQCLTEIGNDILIGCKSNTLYFWDGVSITPNGFLFLPEENTVNMITVNNMAYVFSGSRGNVYITNGNTASLVITVPDYVTGLIDPYFTWGGAMYARGRVWFSLSDQNSGHTGTTGGIWSFVPTQNLFIGQDTGLALRLDHQSSYGTYNGVANVLINIQNQQANGLQYYSAWTSDSVSGARYGIDSSSSSPYTAGQTVIETDFIPLGTFLNKASFTSVETKYSAALVSGENVQVQWRKGITDSWTSIGTDNTVGSLGYRFPLSLAQLIYGQFQIILTSTATNPSFTRFQELRLKK